MEKVTKPRLKRDWIGRYVRLKREVRSGGGDIFDAGEIMYVDDYYRGLSLHDVFRCKCCGRRRVRRIVRIDLNDVEILPEDYKPEGH